MSFILSRIEPKSSAGGGVPPLLPAGILVGDGTTVSGVTPTNGVVFMGNGTTLVPSGITINPITGEVSLMEVSINNRRTILHRLPLPSSASSGFNELGDLALARNLLMAGSTTIQAALITVGGGIRFQGTPLVADAPLGVERIRQDVRQIAAMTDGGGYNTLVTERGIRLALNDFNSSAENGITQTALPNPVIRLGGALTQATDITNLNSFALRFRGTNDILALTNTTATIGAAANNVSLTVQGTTTITGATTANTTLTVGTVAAQRAFFDGTTGNHEIWGQTRFGSNTVTTDRVTITNVGSLFSPNITQLSNTAGRGLRFGAAGQLVNNISTTISGASTNNELPTALSVRNYVQGLWVSPPPTATSTGEVGQMARDANFIYFCYAPNLWSRVARDLGF